MNRELEDSKPFADMGAMSQRPGKPESCVLLSPRCRAVRSRRAYAAQRWGAGRVSSRMKP